MKNTIIYLRQVFGNKVHINDFIEFSHMPMYLVQKFDFKKVTIDNQENQYIFIKPKEKMNIKIDSIKKQTKQINQHTNCIPVLVFNELRLTQRKVLIANFIPFVVPYNQLFLPNVIINLSEKEILEKEYSSEFSVPTQVVFIYILLNNIKETNAHRLSENIPYSVATLNRSLAELVNRELVNTEGNNTRKIYKPINKMDYWKKGKNFLLNPVAKTFYAKQNINHYEFYFSNELALTRLSWDLSESKVSYYATTSDKIKNINKSKLLNEYDIFDYNYSVIEQFKYDPGILSKSNYIDIVSLYAQFKDNYDERIQITLDELLGEVIC